MELQTNAVSFQNIAFAAIVCWFLYWLWSRRRYYAFALRFPGKLGLPIIGSSLSLRHILYDLKLLTKMFERGQQTVCFWMGLYPTIMTYEPEILKKVLHAPECFDKAMPMYEPLQHYFIDGLTTARANKGRFHRKKLNVFFQQHKLLSLYPIFNKYKNKMISEFESYADGKEHILLHPIFVNIGRTVLATTLDDPIYSEKDGLKVFELTEVLLEQVAKESIVSSMNLHKILRWISNKGRHSYFHQNFYGRLIENKFRECNLKNSDMQMENGKLHDQSKRNSLIDIMYKLHEEQQFSMEEVSSEVFTLISAALDTTTKSIFSTIALLAMHPSIQQRLFEEIEQIFKEKDADVQYDNFKELPYLERVIQESMRVIPPVPMIAHRTSEPLELPNGHIVPANMNIVISIFLLHRSKQVWGPNAEKFDPDNFLPENMAKRSAYTYMPFSKGPRNCIGAAYAPQVLKIMLIGLIRNYRFETDFRYEDLKMKFHISSAFIETPSLRVYHRT